MNFGGFPGTRGGAHGGELTADQQQAQMVQMVSFAVRLFSFIPSEDRELGTDMHIYRCKRGWSRVRSKQSYQEVPDSHLGVFLDCSWLVYRTYDPKNFMAACAEIQRCT